LSAYEIVLFFLKIIQTQSIKILRKNIQISSEVKNKYFQLAGKESRLSLYEVWFIGIVIK